VSVNGDITKMKFGLIPHYLYLFLAGVGVFVGVFDLVNYSKGMTFALYGTPVEGWYFITYMIALFGISGILMYMSKINLDRYIKNH